MFGDQLVTFEGRLQQFEQFIQSTSTTTTNASITSIIQTTITNDTTEINFKLKVEPVPRRLNSAARLVFRINRLETKTVGVPDKVAAMFEKKIQMGKDTKNRIRCAWRKVKHHFRKCVKDILKDRDGQIVHM